MRKKLFFLCALFALLAMALPALGERVELLDGRITVELPEGIDFAVRGSVTEEQAAKYGMNSADVEAYMEESGIWVQGVVYDPFVEFNVRVLPTDIDTPFVETSLESLIDLTNYMDESDPNANARVLMHRQVPFIVMDSRGADISTEGFARSYMTIYGDQAVRVSSSTYTEWTDAYDAILSELVDGIRFTGEVDFLSRVVDEIGEGGAVELDCGISLTLPQGWSAAPLYDSSMTAGMTAMSFNKGLEDVNIVCVDLYNDLPETAKRALKRSDMYLKEDEHSYEVMRQGADAGLSTFESNVSSMMIGKSLFPGTEYEDKSVFQALDTQVKTDDALLEIGGKFYLHIESKYNIGFSNDIFICRDLPYVNHTYITMQNGYMYGLACINCYTDALSSDQEKILESVTYSLQ